MPKVPDLNIPMFEVSVPAEKKVKKTKPKKLKNREKHDRLLRLFDGEGYEEFHHPKYVFVKQWNGNNSTWQVAIYTKDSWSRVKPNQ